MTSHSRTRQPTGFTLIETIVVVVILGLMLSIFTGFLPHRPARLELAAATDRVAGALRRARARAIGGSRPVVVRLAVAEHALLVDGTLQTLPADLALALDAPGSVIRFVADGSTSGGTIRLSASSQVRLVAVDWLTGRVTITDER